MAYNLLSKFYEQSGASPATPVRFSRSFRRRFLISNLNVCFLLWDLLTESIKTKPFFFSFFFRGESWQADKHLFQVGRNKPQAPIINTTRMSQSVGEYVKKRSHGDLTGIDVKTGCVAGEV